MATTANVEMTHEELVKEVLKLRADLKKLQKAVRKNAKEVQEAQEGDDAKPKKVSGFAKPMNMSPELCLFLGVPNETQMARTEVTKEINKYVKEHSLQNPDNKRELILDDKLRTILFPPEDVTITFFNLQKYMSSHYIKTAPDATAATATTSATTPPVAKKAVETPKKETPEESDKPKVVKRVVKKVASRPVSAK